VGLGVGKSVWYGDKVLSSLEKDMGGILESALAPLLEASNTKCPYETGALQATGTVSSEGNQGAVSYDTPYACRLHEHPEYHFQNGRQGKWLEVSVHDTQAQILAQIVSGIGALLARSLPG
jgi:hypothetical protein